MHTTNKDVDLELYRVAAEWSRIASDATSRAIDENRRLGVPNVYSINGRIYYELPNGELSLEDPGVSTPPNRATTDGSASHGDV